MNATYIISIARKLGCSIFLLPEDITEVYVLRSGALLGHQLGSRVFIFLSIISGESKDDSYIDCKYYALVHETTC